MKRSNIYLRAGAMLLALMLALLLAACGSDDGGDTDAGAQETSQPEETEEPEETEAAPGEGGGQVVVTATEFEFDLPETLPAGETTVNFVNAGEQPHELLMFKLSDDAPPMEELIQLPQKEAEGFFEGPPSSAFAKPGESQEGAFTTELTTGRYGYVCFVEDKKSKKPHAFLGMSGEFAVE